MNIDGTNTVACLKPIDADTSKPTVITPLPHMFVIKDLVVDLTNFYQQSIEPWLKTKRAAVEGREYRQSPGERKKLDGLYECILCACCSTGTPRSSLVQRLCCMLFDGSPTEERLQSLTEGHKRLYGCRTIRNCTATCPKSLNPADAIQKMKAKHLISEAVGKV
ncbi:hypothetical protein V6N11_043399 [Hibiscus sabdariffa]|uniref:Succinate dehydogenase/fumarate reductase N-terminal domain-containing protein n=1 Tax=Hibiscus sabdariffa TaxID=183260 RepID=A0ABR2RC34_9ROSI